MWEIKNGIILNCPLYYINFSVPEINIRFIDGIRNFILKVWHVTEYESQNWTLRDSILLDVYISMRIVKWYFFA